MKEKSLADQISKLMNQTAGAKTGPGKENTDGPTDDLTERLMAVSGQPDESLETALNDFLSSRGVLNEPTRAALVRGGATGLDDIIVLLTKQFKLSPAVAKMIASLIKNLQPSAAKESGKETVAKKEPRRKSKPKSTAAKKEASSAKKARKKTAAKPKKTTAKPKITASKPAAKKKPTSTNRLGSSKKTVSKTAAKKKPSAKTVKKVSA